MISKKTVLILGAGASVDMGYPTGAELIKQIRRDANERIKEASVGETVWKLYEYFPDFYNVFEQVQVKNVDTFLRDNPRLANDGKAVIIYSLLKNEQIPRGVMPSLSNTKQDSSWLLYLFDAVTRSCGNFPEDLFKSLSNLTIITFNYDLSVEAFFLNQFVSQEKYKTHAQKLMGALNIIHVFGQLYDLKDNAGSHSILTYAKYNREIEKHGTTEGVMQALRMQTLHTARGNINNIHVIGERKHEELSKSAHIIEAKSALREANSIHCIGFAFDADNMNLLRETDYGGWQLKNITFTNLAKSEQLRATAINYFGRKTIELPTTAYEAAMNEIAW